VLVVAQVLVELFVEGGFDDLGGQRLQQAVGAGQGDPGFLGLARHLRDRLTLGRLELGRLLRGWCWGHSFQSGRLHGRRAAAGGCLGHHDSSCPAGRWSHLHRFSDIHDGKRLGES